MGCLQCLRCHQVQATMWICGTTASVFLAGTAEIAAFSFSETPSALSLSGNSNNCAKAVFQGRRKNLFIFFSSKSYYPFYTSGTQSWERLHLQNRFQEVTKGVQRFTGWNTGAVLRSRVVTAARDRWKEGCNSKKIKKIQTRGKSFCVILPKQLILSQWMSWGKTEQESIHGVSSP